MTDAVLRFVQKVQAGEAPAFSSVLGDPTHLWAEACALAEVWRERFSRVVILGVGGSSLGGQLLARGAAAFSEHATGTDLWFVDNVDPFSLARLFAAVGDSLDETAFLCVSKSGETVETLLQMRLVLGLLQERGVDCAQYVAGIAEAGDNTLRRELEALGCPVLEHPAAVGGRYSVFSLVGVLPAWLVGADVAALYKGAAGVLRGFLGEPLQCAPFMRASQNIQAMDKGFTTHVLMGYGDMFRLFLPWFVQLWSESLGKDGKGSLPFGMLGSTDHHSSLQMLLDGVNDKAVTMILPDTRGLGVGVPFEGVGRAGTLSAGDLIYAQGLSAFEELKAQGKPVRLMRVGVPSAELMGALMMEMMLETVCTGLLLGIDPFNQPAVEGVKVRTRGFLVS